MLYQTLSSLLNSSDSPSSMSSKAYAVELKTLRSLRSCLTMESMRLLCWSFSSWIRETSCCLTYSLD